MTSSDVTLAYAIGVIMTSVLAIYLYFFKLRK